MKCEPLPPHLQARLDSLIAQAAEPRNPDSIIEWMIKVDAMVEKGRALIAAQRARTAAALVSNRTAIEREHGKDAA